MEQNEYNEDKIVLNCVSSLALRASKGDYATQIEERLHKIAELFKNDIVLRPMSYKIIKEYEDIVLVCIDENGTIKVNEKKD